MTEYKTDLLDLHRMDCMDFMNGCPDKQFSLAVVDPPYGLDRFKCKDGGQSSAMKNYTNAALWNCNVPTEEYFKELFRISDNQIIWGGNNFNLPTSEYFIVWDKQRAVENFAMAEMAWTSCKIPAMVFRFTWDGFNMTEREVRIHPTQKPVALYRWILANYAHEGDTILDTHLGSMSSCIAAHYAGYHLTGCELDQDYFDAGIERVKRETAQLTLSI